MSDLGEPGPRPDMTDREERKIDRLYEKLYSESAKVTSGKELYEILDLQDWVDDMDLPQGVIRTTTSTPWEKLDQRRQDDWNALGVSLGLLLLTHIDFARFTEAALEEDS